MERQVDSDGLSSLSDGKPIVIGVYGIPGCGKTSVLNRLKEILDHDRFSFYEGSLVINSVVPGGLEAFDRLNQKEKEHSRLMAIRRIQVECMNNGKIGIVAGHFMFWTENEEAGLGVFTKHDAEVFTHILYLYTPPETIAQRCLDDKNKSRPLYSIVHLRRWQQEEKSALRIECYRSGILFFVLPSLQSQALMNKLEQMIQEFTHHGEDHNLSLAKSRLDTIMRSGSFLQGTMLVLDADKTLAPQDTGLLFWELVISKRGCCDEENPLKLLFKNARDRYTYTSFLQAVLLYEESVDEVEFDAFCEQIASRVIMYSEFVSLLHLVAKHDHVGAVVVTCGIPRIWEKILEKEGLSESVKVIGGARIADGFVVTPSVKAALVQQLQDVSGMYVFAFGDSPLDIGMLEEADEAIVIVGEDTRSERVGRILANSFEKGDPQIRQTVLAKNHDAFDTNGSTFVDLAGNEFINSVLRRRQKKGGLSVTLATKNAAKLLATRMRDAQFEGPALRKAHHRAGRYLAVEFLTRIIGVEEHKITHVLGNSAIGYQLRHESRTTIVALMRGGGPMALGVNDIFPLAMFVHADNPEDVKLHHLQGQQTVILVDSVINTGKTIAEFVQAIHAKTPHVRIIVVAGVVQAEYVSFDSILYKTYDCHRNLGIVALRLSETKFTGSRGTDTGNRLFNTLHLP